MATTFRLSVLLAIAFAAGSGCSSGWPTRPFGGYFSSSPSPSYVDGSGGYPETTSNGASDARGGAVSFAPQPPAQPTAWSTVTTSVQKSASAVGGWFGAGGASSAETASNNDPTRLDSPTQPIKAATLVSWAKLNEKRGDLVHAEEYYRKAVETDPKDLVALISYARMFQRQDKLERATEVYRRAIAAYPKSPVAYHDLGQCLARQGQFPQSIEMLNQAVEIDPENKLYRGTLAMVLVEANRPEEAYTHLAAVYTPDVAHYNLGHLLYKKGNQPAAIEQFAQAAQINPNLQQARTMLAKLAPGGAPPAIAAPTAPSSPSGPVNPNSPFAPRAANPAVVTNPHAGGATPPAYGQPAMHPVNYAPHSYGNGSPPPFDSSGIQQPYSGPTLDAPMNAAPPPMPEDYDNGQPQPLPPVY